MGFRAAYTDFLQTRAGLDRWPNVWLEVQNPAMKFKRTPQLRAVRVNGPSMKRFYSGVGQFGKLYNRLEIYFNRLYFFITSFKRSCGIAYTVLPLTPVIVSAATIALIIASSVACTVAAKTGLI